MVPVSSESADKARAANSMESKPLVRDNSFEEPGKLPVLSRLLFGWLTPLLQRGNQKKELDQEDLALVPFPDKFKTERLTSTFDLFWQEEKHRPNPSLYRALFRAFGAEYIGAGLLKLVNDLCSFVGPQVLHAIIVFLRDPDAPLWHGFALTLVVTCSQLTMSLCLRHYFYRVYNTGLTFRTAIVVSVYRKALVLSSAERQRRSLGEITNLMSIDAQRVQDLPIFLHALWYAPLQICLTIFFLWGQLGASSLGGVAVIVTMIPVSKYIAQIMSAMMKKLMQARDSRVDTNCEVLSSMKTIKFQAWEEAFEKRILSLRNKELRALLFYFIANSISMSIWMFTPLLVALATFASYVWSGHNLDVASALTALALFQILRMPMTWLPQLINRIVETNVSINRLRTFLLANEHKSVGVGPLTDVGVLMTNVSAVYDSNQVEVVGDLQPKELADAEWELALLRSQLSDAEARVRELSRGDTQGTRLTGRSFDSVLCLRRVEFACRPNELIVVVGGVGSGKSSFVKLMLGEIRQLSGTTGVSGSLAYFPQTPFILNATVKENILFGHVNEPVNEARYKRVLSCCALKPDLKLLPNGDQTEIGEKGITLSGGQRARVALARAVYHAGDITLIDDALSAVDAHVAKQLFEECIVDELLKPNSRGQRCVILVTNALQFLKHPRVDKIVVLRDGRVAEKGSYAELSNRPGSELARFLTLMNEAGVSADVRKDGAVSQDGSLDDVIKTRSRRRSSTSISEELTKEKASEEARQKGHVDVKVYLSWARSAGGTSVVVVILLSVALFEGAQFISNWWLTYWSSHANSESQGYFLSIYAGISAVALFVNLIQGLVFVVFCLKASRELFKDLLSVILHAPMSFFDTTPIGRIVNRFSKDTFTIDEQLITSLRNYLITVFNILTTVSVISGVSPIFGIIVIPIIAFYLMEQAYFTITYRELKRLDAVNRSPLYAMLGETVDGLSVIRAFHAEESLLRRLLSYLDKQQHAYYLTSSAQSWLGVRLECTGTAVVAFAALSAVIQRYFVGADENFAALAGLAISYSLSVTQSMNWSVRMASDLEANMVSVERVEEYKRIESEGERKTTVDEQLSPSWPARGEIEFQFAKLRYRTGLPLALKGLDLRIPAGSKVGVVGRTGAGKSTLMVSLMRLVELCEGIIRIDGQNVRAVGLAKLRGSMAVIPQDPVLFNGSVRTNLDPFNEFRDEQLHETLGRVGLYGDGRSSSSADGNQPSSSSRPTFRVRSLSDAVSEGGSNFSVGQRQLLVIARALLRGARIVVMDEATAAVDAETDADIQKVMRQEFADATCVTIAHRLNTIMDSDYILVMDDGRAAEFDTPSALLQRGGMFHDLVKAASHY